MTAARIVCVLCAASCQKNGLLFDEMTAVLPGHAGLHLERYTVGARVWSRGFP